MHDLKFYSEIFFRALPVGLFWAAMPVFGSSPPLRDAQAPGYCCHPGPRFSQPEAIHHETCKPVNPELVLNNANFLNHTA